MARRNRFFVMTFWGQFLNYSVEHDVVFTIPIPQSPPNLTVLIDNDHVEFQAHPTPDECVPLRTYPDGLLRKSRSPGNSLKIRPAEFAGPYVLFRHGGLFLSVDDGGKTSVSRPRGLSWETFRLLNEDEYDRLSYFLTNSWYIQSQRNISRFEIDKPAEAFTFHIAGLRLPLETILECIPDSKSKEILIPYDTWILEKFTLFKPLVYYCSFGKEDGFLCLDIAIDTLRRHGAYDGDIKILSERSQEDLSHQYKSYSDDRVQVLEYIPLDVVDYMSARFDISSYEEFDQYQPILYLDTDTMIHAPLTDIFSQALHDKQTTIHVFNEFDEPWTADYWGRELFNDDPGAIPPTYGFTTGIMLYRNLACISASLKAVRDTIMRQSSVWGTRHMLRCYDQPVANYVMHKFESLDSALMTANTRNFDMRLNGADNDTYDAYVSSLGEPILHFAGGVGAYDWKVGAMRRYQAWLDRSNQPNETPEDLLPDAFEPLENVALLHGPQAQSESL
jgi:hypothetical protein